VRAIPSLRTIACFLFGVGSALWVWTPPIQALSGPEAQLIERVNQVRTERRLIALRGSPELARVARTHALDMIRRGYVDHVNPDGESPLDRVRGAGIEGFRLLAENIAASSIRGDRLEAAVEQWLESPIHRENLLNPGRTLFVQLFATF